MQHVIFEVKTMEELKNYLFFSIYVIYVVLWMLYVYVKCAHIKFNKTFELTSSWQSLFRFYFVRLRINDVARSI